MTGPSSDSWEMGRGVGTRAQHVLMFLEHLLGARHSVVASGTGLNKSNSLCAQVAHSLLGGRRSLTGRANEQFMSKNAWEGLREGGPFVWGVWGLSGYGVNLPCPPTLEMRRLRSE